jgi:hypothetical protein
MTTPTEPPRQAPARDLFFFRNPHHWVTWPFLPVVRRHADGTMDYGVLYDALHATGQTGYRSTVLMCNFFLRPETETELLALPKEVFDTSEEMAAAGWRVD